MDPSITVKRRKSVKHTGIAGPVDVGTIEEDDVGDVRVARSHRGLPQECVDYDNLMRELEKREPTVEDFRRLEEHEGSCASGRHSEEGVEMALGLRPGALRWGSREDGLKPPRDIVNELIDEHLGPSVRRGPPA